MMFSLPELIIFSSVLMIIALLVVSNVRMYYVNKKTVASLVQTTLDNFSLKEALDKISNEYELLAIQETDGFVKFLSDSRESAFLYIEEVQESIKVLATAMDSANETNIETAYKNLLKHLPKEENND
jgi:hypothetical protein